MENNEILNKQLSLHLAGNSQNYESFKRMMGASPLLYKHDYLFYNDSIHDRNIRNIQQIKYIKQLLKDGKIESKMINYNTFNTYYPSYVLHHHYAIFVPLLQKMISNPDISKVYKQAVSHQITGAFFQYQLRTDFNKSANEIPTINKNGHIEMNQNVYFYSACTSPFITHAALICRKQETAIFTIVKVRDDNGVFERDIKVKDLGGTISRDITPVGYNFSGVKPLISVQVPFQLVKKLSIFGLKQRFFEFNHSLKDLQMSIWITIKYTTMRRQFKTLEGSKEQRKIVSYQAVAARIIDAFAQLIAFSDLYTRLVENNMSFVVYGQLLQSSHHIILEHLIQLRECCGGFGYLQYSGHPGCIQRVCFRAGSESSKELKMDNLKIGNYFASSEATQNYFMHEITKQTPSYMEYFGVFISVCRGMRNNKDKMTVQEFKRNYLIQNSVMAMHARQDFFRHDEHNPHCLILQYFVASYILKNIAYIDWSIIKVNKSVFVERLTEFKFKFLEGTFKSLQFLNSTLELPFLRNVVIGRQDSDQFYSELLALSKANTRNSKEYVDYIRAPVVQMLVNNRSKL